MDKLINQYALMPCIRFQCLEASENGLHQIVHSVVYDITQINSNRKISVLYWLLENELLRYRDRSCCMKDLASSR